MSNTENELEELKKWDELLKVCAFCEKDLGEYCYHDPFQGGLFCSPQCAKNKWEKDKPLMLEEQMGKIK